MSRRADREHAALTRELARVELERVAAEERARLAKLAAIGVRVVRPRAAGGST